MVHLILALAIAADVGGEVRSAVNDQPIAGVIVSAVGGSDTVRTDTHGRFRLVTSTTTRLRFFRAGYTPRELVAAPGDSTLLVVLTPTARTLEASTITAVRGDDAAPVTRATIDEAELDRRYFGQELPLLLTTAPSVTAYSDAGSFSGYSYMRLRGIDQTRINITLDGIPLNDPEDHFVYFSNFPDLTNSLQSVELQRGVGASSNGVASYAGSLMMESVSLAGGQRGGEVQLERGSFDSNRGSLEYATGLLPSRLSLYARGSVQQTEGYRRNSSNRSESFFLSGGYFGDRDIVKLVAFGGRARNGLAYLAASAEDLAADPRANPLTESERDDFFQDFASAQYTRLLGPDASVGVTAYGMWSDGNYDVRVDPDLENFNLASNAVRCDRDRARTRWSIAAARRCSRERVSTIALRRRQARPRHPPLRQHGRERRCERVRESDVWRGRVVDPRGLAGSVRCLPVRARRECRHHQSSASTGRS